MSDESDENGNGEAQPTEEEMRAVHAMMFQQAVAECAGQLSGFFPSKPDGVLIEAAAKSLQVQTAEGMQAFMADAVNGASIAAHPGWGLRVKRKGATEAGQIGAIIVPVDTSEVRSMDMVNQWISVLAIATSPVARAALDVLGFELQFVRTKTVPGLVRVSG